MQKGNFLDHLTEKCDEECVCGGVSSLAQLNLRTQKVLGILFFFFLLALLSSWTGYFSAKFFPKDGKDSCSCRRLACRHLGNVRGKLASPFQ